MLWTIFSFLFYSIVAISLYIIGSVCAMRLFKLVEEEAFVFYLFMMSLTEIIITGAIYFILVIWLFGFDPSNVLVGFFVGGFVIKFGVEWYRRRGVKKQI